MGIFATRTCITFAALAAVTSAMPAKAAGDLLVAPTRIIIDGARGTEVLLNNIGNEPATYRISLELRRMSVDGTLDELDPALANAKEKAALEMISYAPRKIVLAPNQPQAIRIGVRGLQALADGEYRAHMLFRAIPAPRAIDPAAKPAQGVTISLTPIYGVTIPVIVRKGTLSVAVAISDPKIVRPMITPAKVGAIVDQAPKESSFSFTLTRTGTRSTYGIIRVTRAGVSKPLLEARGIAVYAELDKRQVEIPIDAATAAALVGPVKIEYLQDVDAGGGTLASLQAVIR